MKNQKNQLSLAKFNAWFSSDVKPSYCITTIEVHLSDNSPSKHSAVAGGDNCASRSYDFVKDTKVAKVGIVIRPDWENAITAIYFYGSDLKTIMCWSPGSNLKGAAYTRYEEKEIGEDDELIGFHGIKGKK